MTRESSGGTGEGGGQPALAVAVPIADQIACVERELGFRERLFPRWVKSQKLTQKAADLEMVRMRAVLDSLSELNGLVRRTEERVLDLVTPFVHSSKLVKIEHRLWDVPAWCPKCEKVQPTIDRGETCAVCKLVL